LTEKKGAARPHANPNALTDAGNSFLAAIVTSSDDAIISKDLNGIIRSWNEGARRIFGYEADEIVGQPILRLIPPELHHEEEFILAKIRSGQRIEHFESTRVRKNGEKFPISVTISPIKDDSGTIIGASKIARDITDRKKVERLAVEAEKIATTGRMAAAIAHEINNPLASVLNLIFLARQEGLSPQEIRSYLATAESELERVSHIARQTLGYYRDTGSPAELRLHELIENVLTVYRNRLLAHNIAVEVSFNDLRKIIARSGEIVQVLSNLIANAIDAMPQGGTLSISTAQIRKAEQENLQIVVSDTGQGIRRDQLGRVFEPFFTTKGNLGTGIGLWVARQIVERHGGQISIASSTAPRDSGTVVTITLPFRRSQSSNASGYGSESGREIP
jgi:PAS domain S-box-containing protein